MIPQRNISLLSNRLARDGGRRIPEAVLERDYCLAWFLVGLSRTPLRERLAFKGGTAIKRCYFGDYRFSEDLDFTLTEDVPFETLRAELEPVFREVQRASGVVFRFEREDRQPHVNSHTFYLSYDGPLPARVPSEVKADVTIRERLVLPLVERPVVRGYDEYEDLPDGAAVRVYSLEEIYAMSLDGALLGRGFWLYVWRVTDDSRSVLAEAQDDSRPGRCPRACPSEPTEHPVHGGTTAGRPGRTTRGRTLRCSSRKKRCRRWTRKCSQRPLGCD